MKSLALLVLLLLPACVHRTPEADIARSRARVDLDCSAVTVTRAAPREYVARGCGKVASYRCAERGRKVGINSADTEYEVECTPE